MELLSVIVPCYNEEENIFDFYNELMKNEQFFEKRGLEIEILYIDDGSKDKTADKVKELNARDPRAHLLSFSRNFGKEAAIYAGICNVSGDYTAVMDADLQDPPALLPEMMDAIKTIFNKNISTAVILNVAFLKKDIGIIGSFAFVSMTPKITSMIIEITRSPII